MAKTKKKNKNKRNREEANPYFNNAQSNNNSSKSSNDPPKQIPNTNNEKIEIKNISISTQTDDKNVSIATQTDDIISTTNDTINSNYSHIQTDVFLVPKVPKLPKTLEEKESTRRLIVVLDKACLETCKVTNSNKSSQYQLLNCDDQKTLKKLGSDPTNYRPDITHQVIIF
jgi:hypothetical protein